MKPIIVILSFTLLFLSNQIVAQVAINNLGSQPNSKAMLDVSSETSGILIPRMTTDQRNTFEATLTATEKGMMVFDTETNTFYFYNGTNFDQLSNGVISLLQDADEDTKIEVEQVPDQDVIRFKTAGTEYFAMGQGRLGVHNTGGSVFIGQSAGAGDDLTNNENTGIGFWTMFYNNSGEWNTAVGSESLLSNQSGNNNTALGKASLFNNNSGSSNVAIGSHALYKNTYKSDLVAIGDSALFWNGHGVSTDILATRNSAIGSKTLLNNTRGYDNSAVGYKALHENTTGDQNCAFGSLALKNNISGGSNIAFGDRALYDNLSGYGNVAIGSMSLWYNTSGNWNTAIGSYSLRANIEGEYNTAVGFRASISNKTADYNTAFGIETMFENESGNANVAIGSFALHENISIGYTVAIGDSALFNNGDGANGASEAHFNTAVGSKSQMENTIGGSNTSVGYRSLYANIGGDYNTALGKSTLHENETGNHNTAVGSDALYNNTGNSNTATGSQSLFTNITGGKNTANGNESLTLNQTGSDNTALGYATMLMNTAGSENTAVGSRALNNSTGNGNIAVGLNALYNTTGDHNIALGYKAGDNLTWGNRNIVIGYDIDMPIATYSEKLNIGNLIFGEDLDGTGTTISSGNIGIGTNNPSFKLDVHGNMQVKSNTGNVFLYIDPPMNSGNSEIQFQEGNNYRGAIGYNTDNNYMYFYEGGNMVLNDGNLGIGTSTPGYRLQVGNSGDGSTARANAWNTFSDRNLKTDLSIIENPMEKINQVSGYYYYWKDGEDDDRQVGVIAQEVEDVLPEIVSTDAEGIKSLDYSKLTPLLIEALKEQQQTINDLKSRIEALEN